MHISRHRFKRIRQYLPKPRGSVRISHFRFLNALAFMASNGCKWRSLPERFGAWHPNYMRLYRWAHSGLLNEVLQILHHQSASRRLWSTQKNGPQAIGKSRAGWITKIHMVAASFRAALVWSLTPGQAGDSPEGRNLIEAVGPQDALVYLLMDTAYEGDDIRPAALQRNLMPVVPAHPKRKHPWNLDKRRYRKRNEVERLFRRIKAYRRIFTRYDKLDVMYATFVSISLICEHLRECEHALGPSN